MSDGVATRTRALVRLLEPAAGGLPVAVRGGANTPAEAVFLTLRSVAPEARPREAAATLVLMLDYRVEVVTADPLRIHDVIGELAFAILAEPDLQMLPSVAGPPSAAETGLGLAFTARLIRERSVAPVKRVREPLRVVMGPTVALEGVVLGPRDVPIGDAEILIPALDRRSRSDAQGRFRFDGLPPGPNPINLAVAAKGVRLASSAVPGEPITIRVPLEA